MRRISFLFASVLALAAAPVAAREIVEEKVVWVDEDGHEVAPPMDSGKNWRLVDSGNVDLPRDMARFGPFRVLDAGRAAMVDVSDENSPAAFSAMLQAYPAIRTLEMIEVPGTLDDRANLKLGRMIRAANIATHVPSGGSVRSGGVELFLAGSRHEADEGSEFAVHSWADEDGRSPGDYGADAPENQAYIDYYTEMGMSREEARTFYAMTNSVPFEQALWLGRADMAKWVRLD